MIVISAKSDIKILTLIISGQNSQGQLHKLERWVNEKLNAAFYPSDRQVIEKKIMRNQVPDYCKLSSLLKMQCFGYTTAT